MMWLAVKMFIRMVTSYVVWWLAQKIVYRLANWLDYDFLWDWYIAMSAASRKIQGNADGPWVS